MEALNIRNGIIGNKTILGVEFISKIVNLSGRLRNVRTLRNRTDTIGITYHNTANTARGADALMHARYLQNVESSDKSYISFHFAVDSKRIVQVIPLNEVTWHAGDGRNGKGNCKTISIEICENADGNIRKAEENAQKLGAMLLETYGDIKIYKHQDFSGKYCPRVILNRNGWNEFVEGIYKIKDSLHIKKFATWEDELLEATKWAKVHKISDCERLDDNVTRKEVITMLFRMNNFLNK